MFRRTLSIYRVAFLPWGPLDAHAFAPEAPLASAGGRLAGVARQLGVKPGQVALAWLLAQGDHVIPIPGTTSVEHLEENMAAAEIVLDAETLAELSADVAA